MMKAILSIFVAGFCLVSQVKADFRVWSSKDGTSNVEAQFIQMTGNRVVLEKQDGKRVLVPLDKLCAKDLEYLAAVVPPELKIEVDRDKDSNKLGEGWSYTYKEETYAFNVNIQKVSKGGCSQKLKAYMYVVAESKRGNAKKVIAFKEHSFSLEKNSSTRFTVNTSVKNEDYWGGSWGWEYEGYIIVVKTADGKIIATDSTKSAYDGKLQLLEQNKSGEKTFQL